MAQEESRHLLSTADDNKDGKLSEEEIVNNHETFVGSEATDYGRALPKHEELWVLVLVLLHEKNSFWQKKKNFYRKRLGLKTFPTETC